MKGSTGRRPAKPRTRSVRPASFAVRERPPAYGAHEKEYIIFCDESDREGKYYSNFYGGLIVGASQYMRVSAVLDKIKQEQHLFGDVKWEKVSEQYLPKYVALMRAFFAEVTAGNVKVRIMFRQKAFRPTGLTREDYEMRYFKLYYQFIKHAFGLALVPRMSGGIRLRLYFDRLPETREKTEMFKGFIHAIQTTRTFAASGITLDRQDITEVRTRDHVLLQCLDTVLGSMAFRLNDKHKQKLPGSRVRGRRTRAKEALYRFMLGEIRGLLPGFNIGVTTGSRGDPASRWNQPYRHWCFQPKASVFDGELTKR
jgi:hypothetical protein